MKYFIFISFILASVSYNYLVSQTVLNPGDILFIGFKTSTDDEAGNDCVKLVTLVSLECNTKFIVTDNNWNNSTDNWYCSNDEFGLEITCNVPIMAGSIFYIDVDASGGVANCSGGSITKTNVGTSSTFGTNYGLNDSGDNLFVMQGSYASPTFISALKHSGAFAIADCSNKNNTSLPDNLSLATSAIMMASTQDQWHYRCSSLSTGTKSSLKSSILNNANWTFANGMGWDNSSCMFDVTDDAVSQSPSGTLAVSGSGCGCLANCNLTQWGGVNCGATGVAGDCTAGYQNMSRNINVPAGCTYTVTATMRPRGGSICSASGADGSCATCDVVKVDVLGGSKSFQSGGSNATLNDSYTLAGPGTIVVSGKSNRADEIITYTIGIPCGSCLTILPIELGEFSVLKDGENAKIEWMTFSERENAYFTVEKSNDGINWEILYIMNGQGNSTSPYYYTIIDSSPYEGVTYYKLSQTDFNGKTSENGIRFINFKKQEIKVISEFNILGQIITSNEQGFVIQILENGETRKIYRE